MIEYIDAMSLRNLHQAFFEGPIDATIKTSLNEAFERAQFPAILYEDKHVKKICLDILKADNRVQGDLLLQGHDLADAQVKQIIKNYLENNTKAKN